MEIEGKVAIVTGAAAGIGAAIAQRLVEGGARVVVADLDGDGAELVRQQLEQIREGSAVAFGGDVSTEESLTAMIAAAQSSFGPVDMFFANAGVGLGSGLAATEDAWELGFQVNVMAHVRAARALVPQWLERGEGYFFSTASAAGLLTQIGSPVYAVTKHGAVAFAEWLRVTYGHKGVRVSCLCPMGVNTNLLNAGSESDDVDAQASAAAVRNSGAVIEPLECADVVMQTVADETFLCLPHPEVLEFFRRKGGDYDRWIGGMQRYQDSLG
ncbi:MAG: SDR family oxidoreductase [Micrococcales bacterium]|nr:SDR family oxidoreductase [Micrococcales bacterium]